MTGYQRMIFDIEKMYPDTAVCNIGGIIHFSGDAAQEQMIGAARAFLEETPAARLRIARDERLYVSEEIHLPDRAEKTEDALSEAECFMREPFELFDAPLYAFRLFDTPQGYVGAIKLHHIIGDYMALYSFFRRLEKLSGGMPKKNAVLSAAEEIIDAEAREHYAARFREMKPQTLFDAPKTIRAGVVKRELKGSHKLLKFCRENGIRVQSAISAAIALYMKKTRGAAHTIIGASMMNRDRHTLYKFGMYANIMPLFIRTEGNFLSVCKNADTEGDYAAKYASYPYGTMLSDCGIRERGFDIGVNYISAGMLPKLRIGETEKLYNGCCEVPLRLHIIRHKDSLLVEAEHMLEVFPADAVHGLIASLENIIECGIDGRKITAASPEDIAAYERLNAVKRVSADTTVSRLFAAYAAEHPDETAYIYEGEAVTYREAQMTANNIAVKVSGKSVAAIACGRCRYLIPAMLGTMAAGAAYMPVDPKREMPECDIVLSLSEYNIENSVCLDRLQYINKDFKDVSAPDKPAYHMRTSGSTGAAKTVVISNRSLYIRLLWMHEKYGLDKRILQKTSLTFDVSGWELLSPAFGGTLVLMRDGEERDTDIIADYVRQYKIQMLHFVPTVMKLFFEEDREGLDSLTDIISSGEALDRAAVSLVKRRLPKAALHNLYGPTECTIDVSYYDCTGYEYDVPIGTPVYNTGLYIVNDDSELMPIGTDGELLVTGNLVGEGYIGETGGYTSFNGERAYRTGDICYLGFDGLIYYVGRRDRQIKLNGKRTDLGGLELMTAQIEGISACAALCDDDRVYLFYKGTASEEHIRQELMRKTDRLPSFVLRVKEMPVTGSGKLDRSALKRLLKERRAGFEPPKTAAEREIHDAVLAELNRGGELYEGLDVNEDIFDAGLTSLSVIALTQRLKKYGFSVQDFYAGRTIRNIAAQGRFDTGGIVYLKRAESKRLLICFPYAGGEPQAFGRIAKEFDGDAVGMDYSWFGKESGACEIAKAAADFAKSYDEIYLISACIGSAFLTETAYLLEKEGKPLKEMYIIASLPLKSEHKSNPWRRIPRMLLGGILSRMSGKDLPKDLPLDSFLRDTDRYFAYHEKRRINAPAHLLFARDDGFTAGFEKKCALWDARFEKKPEMTVFESGGHYFFERESGVLDRIRGDEVWR